LLDLRRSRGFRECVNHIQDLADEKSGRFMPDPERRVKMTNLISEYFLNAYKLENQRNVPVVRNALRRMPVVVKADDFMGNIMDALM
jgi:hypothetical protein